jgi:CBS domain-containing protein
MQTTIRDILKRKGDSTVSVTSHASVLDAVRAMAHHNVGSVLVIDDGRLVGILSERDCARDLVLKDLSAKDTRVEELMTTEVLIVGPTHTVDECMFLMTENRVRHLPVLQDGTLIGIVSIGDIVNALVSQKQFVIEQLESYITGRS